MRKIYNSIKNKMLMVSAASILSTGAFAQVDVLVCGAVDDSTWLIDVQNKLIATGNFNSVQKFNIYYGTPTLTYLQNFDAVMVFTDYDSNDPFMLGDTLAAYIDGGGGVVNCVFSNASVPILGAFNSPTYQVVIPAGGQLESPLLTLGTILDYCSPIMSGITSFDGGSSSFRSTATTLAGGWFTANWSNGEWLVAQRENVGPSNARRADLNFYPPSSDVRSDLWNSTTQGGDIMGNALLWVAGVTDHVPVVTANVADDSVCVSATAVILNGLPSGGTWSGSTAISGTTFNPSAAGTGNYTLVYSFTDTNGCTANESIPVNVDACVGIAENNLLTGLSVYPNPSNGNFNITTNGAELTSLEIVALDGTKVYSAALNNVFATTVDASMLANGIYMVRLTGDGVQHTVRISVQK